jgi:hypothetical protein
VAGPDELTTFRAAGISFCATKVNLRYLLIVMRACRGRAAAPVKLGANRRFDGWTVRCCAAFIALQKILSAVHGG